MTTNTTDHITDLCKRHGLPELGRTLIERNATIEQANAAILEELAARDRASGGHLNVVNHRNTTTTSAMITETLVARLGGKVKGETIRATDLTGLAVRSWK